VFSGKNAQLHMCQETATLAPSIIGFRI
jgi:hypothetical protein